MGTDTRSAIEAGIPRALSLAVEQTVRDLMTLDPRAQIRLTGETPSILTARRMADFRGPEPCVDRNSPVAERPLNDPRLAFTLLILAFTAPS